MFFLLLMIYLMNIISDKSITLLLVDMLESQHATKLLLAHARKDRDIKMI